MINIRSVQSKDLDQVVELENQIWPEGTRASREKFESRFNIFPQGFLIGFKDGGAIGVSTSEIIDYDPENPPNSWETVTDNGYIRNHSSNGNALYVVSIGAVSRSGGGSALVSAQIELAKKLNLRFLILGARIPGFNKYCRENQEINIHEYVMLKRDNGELLDPELRFYIRNGLRLSRIMPNYMEDDKESRNYGAIMVWENDTAC